MFLALPSPDQYKWNAHSLPQVGTLPFHCPSAWHVLSAGPLNVYPVSHEYLATSPKEVPALVSKLPLLGMPGRPHEIPTEIDIQTYGNSTVHETWTRGKTDLATVHISLSQVGTLPFHRSSAWHVLSAGPFKVYPASHEYVATSLKEVPALVSTRPLLGVPGAPQETPTGK